MPADASAAKIERTRGWGAEVVRYDRATEDREALGRRLSAERGLVLVPPYDDHRVVAGAGTLGLEVARQAAALGAAPNALLVCCAGGGLAAGCALAWEARLPGARVFGVEPESFDDTARSLAAGERVGNAPDARSVCDALLAPMPGVLTFAVNARRLGGVVVASDADALAAVRVAFAEFGLVAEPGGAIALAAVISGRFPVEGRTVAVASTARAGLRPVARMTARSSPPRPGTCQPFCWTRSLRAGACWSRSSCGATTAAT